MKYAPKMSTFISVREYAIKLEEDNIEIEVIPEEDYEAGAYLKLSLKELQFILDEHKRLFGEYYHEAD